MDASLICIIAALVICIIIAIIFIVVEARDSEVKAEKKIINKTMENNSTVENKELVSRDIDTFYLKSIHENISTIKFWIVFWSIISIIGGVIYLLFFIGASLD